MKKYLFIIVSILLIFLSACNTSSKSTDMDLQTTPEDSISSDSDESGAIEDELEALRKEWEERLAKIEELAALYDTEFQNTQSEETQITMRAFLIDHEDELTQIAEQMLVTIEDGQSLVYNDQDGFVLYDYAEYPYATLHHLEAPEILNSILTLETSPFTSIYATKLYANINQETYCDFTVSLFDRDFNYCDLELRYAADEDYVPDMEIYPSAEHLKPHWFLCESSYQWSLGEFLAHSLYGD